MTHSFFKGMSPRVQEIIGEAAKAHGGIPENMETYTSNAGSPLIQTWTGSRPGRSPLVITKIGVGTPRPHPEQPDTTMIDTEGKVIVGKVLGLPLFAYHVDEAIALLEERLEILRGIATS